MIRKECLFLQRVKPTRGVDYNHSPSNPTASKKGPLKRPDPQSKRYKSLSPKIAAIVNNPKPLIEMDVEELDWTFGVLEDMVTERYK